MQIGTATNWASVAAGYDHTVAVRTDGTLWAWGCNDYGQLGDGTTTDRHAPVQIGTATNWASVAAGSVPHGGGAHRRHAVGLGLQRLRAARRRHHHRPPRPGADRHRHQLGQRRRGRYGHTVAVRTDGTLWAWGRNNYGQLGDGTTTPRLAPEQIGTATNWASVSAGWYHTVAVRTERHAVGLGLQPLRAARRRHHHRSPQARADRHAHELNQHPARLDRVAARPDEPGV